MSAPAEPSRIFRQAALDKLSSPEQLDELVTIAETRGWIAAAGLGLVLVVFLAWGFFGTVSTEVEADGILVRRGGRVVGAMAPAAGTIERLLVKPGDIVNRGQPIAALMQPELTLRLTNAEQVARERRSELAERERAMAVETEALERNAQERRVAYREVIELASERLGRLRIQLRLREGLRNQALVPEDRVEQMRADINQAQEEASANRAKLAELDTELLRYRIQSNRDMEDSRRLATEAERAMAEARLALEVARVVLAPAAGRVTELAVSDGQLVAQSALVLNVETEGEGLQAVVYVPTEHGKKVQPGMRVRLAPSTVRKEEYGTMLGAVAEVSAFPVTPQGMLAVLQNQNLVNGYAAAGAPYETRINLEAAATPTGYAWTSGAGPALDLTSGTTVRVAIAVRDEAPFNLILPFLGINTGSR